MMDQKEKKVPFSDVLTNIFEQDPVPVALLYRLSDMTSEEFLRFRRGWATLEVDRRRELVRHMADITEENFLVDFYPIFKELLDDGDEEVRKAALDGLWDNGDTTLVKPIVAMMESDPSLFVRTAAAATLSHFVLLIEWGQVDKGIKEPIIEALLNQWDKPDASLPLRRAVVEAIGAAAHPRVAEIITAGYQSNNQDMQRSAVFAMGLSASKAWLPIVMGEMESPYEEMRAEAARAAGDIGRSDALDGLERLLADSDRDVQLAAISALGQIGSELATELLNDFRSAVDEEDDLLLEAIDEALEDADWLVGGIDFSLIDFEDDGDEEDVIADLDL